MTKLTESVIEYFTIKLFERLDVGRIHFQLATDCSQLKMAGGISCPELPDN